ncbi:uncharacterized protein LOC121731843 isoform X1 [Aricia agestis]|uniref:uncharacterized protein LOC121731843 isoform X1 n=1 Tax=Aricia agestis TaxID=91739 RepID=UPI001C205563|nr:uncharacterized protein LOC121731843 isoform X1 [Aricia agestis]
MRCCQFVVLLLLYQTLPSHEDEAEICPIGFEVSYTKGNRPICHRLKGPEAFEDVYEDCIGNMFSVKLYRELKLDKIEPPKHKIWTEYKSFYPGGLPVDTSRTSHFGDELAPASIESIDRDINIDEEWCAVLDPHTNFTLVKCSEKHYRYCFVDAYPDADEVTNEGCEGFEGSMRFRSPISTCVAAVEGAGGGSVRATWSQARDLCAARGGSLLYRGWRYANRVYASSSKTINRILPLGVKMNDDSLRYDALDDHSEVPQSKRHFKENGSKYDESFGAQQEVYWYLVNSSYVFYNVACERAVPLRNLGLHLTIDYDKKLMKLAINDTIDPDDITCYTDSIVRYPEPVSKVTGGKYWYRLNENGYYWCSHKDLTTYAPSESNKILYIKKPEAVKNVFAIKIQLGEAYTPSGFQKKFKYIWKYKVLRYLYFKYQYENKYGKLNGPSEEGVLRKYMNEKKENYTEDVRSDVKRLYLDMRTVLVHVLLEPPNMGKVSPGTWEGMRIVYVKPVYFCTDDGIDTPLGGSVNSSVCKTRSCVGDYMEGVSSVETKREGCKAPNVEAVTTQTANDTRTWSGESSEESTEFAPNITLPLTTEMLPTWEPAPDPSTEPVSEPFLEPIPEPSSESSSEPCSDPIEETTATVTMVVPPRPPKPTTTKKPTTTPPPMTTDLPATTEVPRDQQVQEVINELEGLLSNEGNLTVGDIDDVFTNVDAILNEDDDLEIPGQLLDLLEQLGNTVVLNDTEQIVRPNIALLMADARPQNPIRGFRIAVVNDTFEEHDFEFISEAPNSTVLNAGESEVVVNLPPSVSESERRVSFVVFRNDRAFHSQGFAVNSRVLSVNVENVTHFHGGEVIDIHLSPIVTTLARNESRSCAYWHFLENRTGYWSQEGCTFIRATEEGMLDTCRCNHLTHFAEVLAPKAVFSEADESALEIISIVGCFLSILGLIMIGVTALLFRSWRREYSNKIWLQLCMAIFITVLSFLLVIFVHFDQQDMLCLLVGVLLHYAVLASFCWMLVAAVLAYRRLVLVFSRDASHKLLKAATFSWGAPCVVVGVLLSVSRDSYGRTFEEMTPSGTFCYPTGVGFWLTVYAPISAILLTNWILFALIVRSVFVSRRIQRHGENNEALRCASVSCMLVFLFGLPWIFGLFASNVVAAYLFTLTATFQGFILFVFFVIGNKKTRDLWLNKLHIKQTRKVPVTSSTYTNRSAEWRAANAPAALEAKVSKPKVLASKDETRFS